MLGKFRYDALMYFLLGVVFALWQWIQQQKALRASPGIMLYAKITLVWLQSQVENGLPTAGNIHLIEIILSCQQVLGVVSFTEISVQGLFEFKFI